MSYRVRTHRCVVAAAVGAGLTAVMCSASVDAASLFEKSFYLLGPRFDSNMPACGDDWPRLIIKQRFTTKEGRLWNSDLRITDFDQFCTSRALTSDGQWRKSAIPSSKTAS